MRRRSLDLLKPRLIKLLNQGMQPLPIHVTDVILGQPVKRQRNGLLQKVSTQKSNLTFADVIRA